MSTPWGTCCRLRENAFFITNIRIHKEVRANPTDVWTSPFLILFKKMSALSQLWNSTLNLFRFFISLVLLFIIIHNYFEKNLFKYSSEILKNCIFFSKYFRTFLNLFNLFDYVKLCLNCLEIDQKCSKVHFSFGKFRDYFEYGAIFVYCFGTFNYFYQLYCETDSRNVSSEKKTLRNAMKIFKPFEEYAVAVDQKY